MTATGKGKLKAGLLVFAISFGLLVNGGRAMAQEDQEQVPVEVVNAIERQMADRNWIPGTVMGVHDSRIAAEVDGRLETVLDVGERVKKGDTLAKIESLTQSLHVAEMEAEILPKEARLDFLQREVKRLSVLAEQNNAAKSRLDETASELKQTRGELKVARARLAQSRDLLSRTVIRAPFNGVISERYKAVGERVESGDQVVRLVNTDDLEIQVRVTPQTIANLAMTEELLVKDIEESTTARLRTYVPVGDAISRLYELRLSFEKDNWMSGHAVRVLVPASASKKVVAVPRDALVIRQNNISVYRINKDLQAEYVAVEIGMSQDELVEIIGQVSGGDRIVIRGNERLRPGQQVKILSDIDSP